ncbi:hypothetical protein MKZ38_009325 [Zalerion maritima]|uniref:Uncharacterized protein n=1 Tax=Zalerion maritima TaxID=339359 RepID=A0AAD5WN69_9PEZI|nr:hypothetical protein MKZ38_009325 [Zalerion maritima]
MVSIAVQPPAYAQANQELYPPLVVKAKGLQHVAAVAVLVDYQGNPVDNALQGNYSDTGHQLTDDGNTMFIFPHLIIPSAGGYYRLRVDVYEIDSETGDWRMTARTYSREIVAYDETVQYNEQQTRIYALDTGSSEMAVMRLLREQGYLQ